MWLRQTTNFQPYFDILSKVMNAFSCESDSHEIGFQIWFISDATKFENVVCCISCVALLGLFFLLVIKQVRQSFSSIPVLKLQTPFV